MLSLSVASLALVLAAVGTWRAFRGSSSDVTALVEPYDDSEVVEVVSALAAEIAEIRADYDGWQAALNTAVAEGIQHVDRSERRIKAVVQRARQKLAESGVESEGLEAEFRDLHAVDAPGGEAQGVQPVRADVGGPAEDFSAFPGQWLPEHVADLRGDR